MAGAADQRPLSPHLQVWRFHITLFASITHRITGGILYFVVIGLAGWLCALAAGRETYDALIALAPPWLIWAKLYAMAAVLAFHFANGVRHLIWDSGRGFKLGAANAGAWFVYLFALAAPFGLYALMQR